MSVPSPRRIHQYARKQLRLARFLRSPGDGRVKPQILARDLIWAVLIGVILRACSFHAIEAVARKRTRGLGLSSSFGDDAIGYFVQRLDPQVIRAALADTIKRSKRNKAFDDCRRIGIALDGTGAARCREAQCVLCRPVRNDKREVVGHHHRFCMASVVGAQMSLPVDVEPYGPGDSEYSAGQRLIARVTDHLGARFAQFVVTDGEFSTATFVHAANDAGLHVVSRLKDNLPTLFAAAQKRFVGTPPKHDLLIDGDRVELWDADDFDPWDSLRWQTVRVLRYVQHRPHGPTIEAYWLTDFSPVEAGSVALYGYAKSRWRAIENHGFNDGKNRYGLEHTPRHHANALLMWWLIVAFAMTIERLFRCRFLHRGAHRPRTSADLHLSLWLSLGATKANTS